MKILLLSIAVAFVAAGCTQVAYTVAAPDLSVGSGAVSDLAGQSSSDMAQSKSGDGGGNGMAAFGALCTVNGDCMSNICDKFAMGAVYRCTKSCTTATQATDCPAPSDGTCNANNVCKFDS